MDNISFNIEKELLSDGYRIIAGVDEAGRGALAGPLCVGLVIYNHSIINNPPEEILTKINDSKKLSPLQREKALSLINLNSEYTATAIISHRIIDRTNINVATEYAVKKLIERARPAPEIVIMDGNFSFNTGIPMVSVIKGDSKSISIASGSIAAKVRRDRLMKKYELIYPGYSFNKNMGYGTLEHRKAIYRIGPSMIHRKTYEPVKGMINDKESILLFPDKSGSYTDENL